MTQELKKAIIEWPDSALENIEQLLKGNVKIKSFTTNYRAGAFYLAIHTQGELILFEGSYKEVINYLKEF